MFSGFFKKIRLFLEMIKFEHSVFALPFAYLGLFLAAGGWPAFSVFLWVTVAMVSFRTTAMSLNRIIDRWIDARNPRTAGRAIPAGHLKVPFTWVTALFSFFVFAFSAWRLGPVCFGLCWIPAGLAFLYPWMKRFSWLSHGVLGSILAIAPSGAWLAAGRELSLVPVFFSCGVACWVAGFDIIYALQDEDFDRTSGLHSVPARWGRTVSLRTVMVLHGVAVVFWAGAGLLAPLGFFYSIGLALTAGMLLRENLLIRRYGMQKLQEAFFRLNAWISLVLFVSVLADLWTKK
ncbi:MAG: UbiA-like polyprenyltransferase [Candidatus Omnitrophota bacterium]